MKFIFALSLAISTFVVCSGAEYYVDNLKGNDRNAGSADAPFKTIGRGVSRLKAGDTLLLTANPGTPYYENLVMRGLAGTPEAPITVDGRNAVLCGSPSSQTADYEALGDGLFSRKLKLDSNRQTRYNLIIDGVYQRMGRAMKSGRKVPFKAPAELKDGEWTYDAAAEMIYVRLPAGKIPGPDTMREPDMKQASGVMVSRACKHLVIRNITVENFWNDGFNIHGSSKDILFENIKAFYNGDDGISAHEDAEIRVDGFEARGNATGICHVNDAIAIHRNVKLSGAAGIELDLSNKHNEFENLEIVSSAPRGINLNSKTLRIKGGKLVYERPAKSSVRTPNPDITDFAMP